MQSGLGRYSSYKAVATRSKNMRSFPLILGLLAVATFISPARSQYVPYPANPTYMPPSGAPQSYTPPSAAPQYGPTLGRQAPGYQWREERATTDWRNNTWRERQPDVTRNQTWREERANEDWHQRQGYARETTKNNAADRGNVECGVGAAGSSVPCQNYATEKPKRNTADRTSIECGPESVAESCRSRRAIEDDNPIVQQKKRPAAKE